MARPSRSDRPAAASVGLHAKAAETQRHAWQKAAGSINQGQARSAIATADGSQASGIASDGQAPGGQAMTRRKGEITLPDINRARDLRRSSTKVYCGVGERRNSC
jgi:hypothetical protein